MRLFALALVCAALPASAQTLDADARPLAGAAAARADSAPAAFDITPRASDAHPDPMCPGRLGAGAPDAAVDWSGGDLTVWARVAADVTLTVVGPDGTVHCEDDTQGRLPVVALPDAPAGRYALWLGAFAADDSDATLYAGTSPAPSLDAQAPTQAGVFSLDAGFGERTVTVSAAGQDRVDGVDDPDGNPCEGYVRADRPAIRLRHTAPGPLVLSASSDTDLVLFADTPGGIACSDDGPESVDPLLVLDSAPAGDYTVWVGTWGSIARTADVRAELRISDEVVREDDIIQDIELDLDPAPLGPYSVGTYTPFDPDADAALRVDFEGGDLVRLPLPDGSAGGRVPNPVAGSLCRGFLPLTPQLHVDLDAEGPIALRAEGETDLVLVARLPDGTWMCSDDADGPNPGIQIDGRQRGAMRVWVGTFSAADAADAVVTLGAGRVTAPPPPPPMPPPSPGGRSDTPFTRGDYSGGLAPDAPLRTLQLDGTRVRANVLAAGTLENPLQGQACVGYLTAEPSAAVEVASGAPLSVRAYSATDAVMVVRTPGGDWYCSDDAEGTEPEVTFDGEAGTYAVWLGTFSAGGDGAQMTLTVSHPE